MTKYKIVGFTFDLVRWGYDIRRAMQYIAPDYLAGLLEVDHSTLENWRDGRYKSTKAPYPMMTNFIKVCNLLDLDPRDYFVLEQAHDLPANTDVPHTRF